MLMIARSTFAAILALEVAALRPGSVHDLGPAIPHFDLFKLRFGRSYHAESPEHFERLAHYNERAKAARQQNMDPARLWDADVNHLWDWTPEEVSHLNGYRRHARSRPIGDVLIQEEDEYVDRVLDKTASKEWELLALRPVDQGACGSCWAVSVATVLTAHAEIAGLNRTFSAQHMLNCVQNPRHCGGTGGCEGATAELAFEYAKTFGVPTPEEVSYTGRDDPCQSEFNSPVQGLVSWKTLPENKVKPLMLAVLDHGPAVVSVGATSWALYGKGIWDFCGPNAIVNHAVSLIGFGSEDGTGYWKILNSWGDDWGEGGHIRLLRTEDEEEYCGMDKQPQDGVGCDGGPSEVRVCGRCGILMDASVPVFSM